jgi:hypothetical protein
MFLQDKENGQIPEKDRDNDQKISEDELLLDEDDDQETSEDNLLPDEDCEQGISEDGQIPGRDFGISEGILPLIEEEVEVVSGWPRIRMPPLVETFKKIFPSRR